MNGTFSLRQRKHTFKMTQPQRATQLPYSTSTVTAQRRQRQDKGSVSSHTSEEHQYTQLCSDGDNVMIGGFIVEGTDKRVIIRAIGSELSRKVLQIY